MSPKFMSFWKHITQWPHLVLTIYSWVGEPYTGVQLTSQEAQTWWKLSPLPQKPPAVHRSSVSGGAGKVLTVMTDSGCGPQIVEVTKSSLSCSSVNHTKVIQQDFDFLPLLLTFTVMSITEQTSWSLALLSTCDYLSRVRPQWGK